MNLNGLKSAKERIFYFLLENELTYENDCKYEQINGKKGKNKKSKIKKTKIR